jgi:undecaprenyl-phosphate alpha-N-acetylglucosaminyl 1-phosphatetransferase
MDDAKLVAASAIALAVTLFAIFSMRPLARRLGLVDRPDARKRHRGRVPLIGGLCFFLGTVVGLLYLGYIDRFVASLLVPCALIVITGAVDDFGNLSVRSRLIIQTCAAGMVIAATGVYLDYTGQVFGASGLDLGLVGIPITILAVIGLINAFNMLDGIDGLAASLAMVSIGAIMLFANIGWPMLGVILLLQVLFASLIPYLFVNMGWPDGRKVFMGDAGSTLIGFLLGWSLIYLSHRGVERIAPVDALWCVALPVMDTLAVMARRIRKGISPFKADRQHLHHLLQDTGCSPRVTLAAIVTSSGLLALAGYALRNAPEMLSGGMFLALLTVYVLRFQQALEWLCATLRRIRNREQGLDPLSAALIPIAAKIPLTRPLSSVGMPKRPDAIRTLCVMATETDAIRIAPIARQLSADARFDSRVCIAAQPDQTPAQVLGLFGIEPDMQLRVTPRAGQADDITSMTLGGMKRVLGEFKPDVLLVPSDASATLAATLAAFYQQIPVVCIEPGGNLTQPAGDRLNEASRRITSALASLHFTPSEAAGRHLLDVGVPADRIVISGNTAVGTLRAAAERIAQDAVLQRDLARCFAFLRPGRPLLLMADGDGTTFNNLDPSGSDLELQPGLAPGDRDGSEAALERVCRVLRKIAMRRPDVDIVYPVDTAHSATEKFDALLRACPNVHLIAPTDYLGFAYLLTSARIVLADSKALAIEIASLGKRVLLMQDPPEHAHQPQVRNLTCVGSHEQAVATAALDVLDDDRAGEAALRTTGRSTHADACVRIVEALVGFVGHAAAASAVARPMSALQVSSIAEALREAS